MLHQVSAELKSFLIQEDSGKFPGNAWYWGFCPSGGSEDLFTPCGQNKIKLVWQEVWMFLLATNTGCLLWANAPSSLKSASVIMISPCVSWRPFFVTQPNWASWPRSCTLPLRNAMRITRYLKTDLRNFVQNCWTYLRPKGSPRKSLLLHKPAWSVYIPVIIIITWRLQIAFVSAFVSRIRLLLVPRIEHYVCGCPYLHVINILSFWDTSASPSDHTAHLFPVFQYLFLSLPS